MIIEEAERIAGPNGAIVLAECDGQWFRGVEAALLDAELLRVLAQELPFPARGEAIVDGAQVLIDWCAEQKYTGSRKHRKQATALQDWALAEQKAALMAAVPVGAASEQAAAIGESCNSGVEDDAIPAAEVEAMRSLLQRGAMTGDEAEAAGRQAYEALSEGEVIQQTASEQTEERRADPHAVEGPPSHARVTRPDYEIVPLPLIDESPLNPRKSYPEAKLAELEQSIRMHGFREWLPLVVRPALEGRYQIAAGHRRRRAAIRAGLAEVPCTVRDMSDAELLEILTFDNGGREDVHPIEEADGWRAWMEQTGETAQDIAARIGKSLSYVCQRLKYADLTPDARAAFVAGSLNARNAVLIARLLPRYQAQALAFCFPAHDPEREVSSRELAAWIKSNCQLSLLHCGFDPTDDELFPFAGACTDCPKRAGSRPEIFADLDPQTCTDPSCFREKEAWAAEVKRAAAPPSARVPVAEPKPAPVPEPEDRTTLTEVIDSQREADAALRKAEKDRKEWERGQKEIDERARVEQAATNAKQAARTKLAYRRTVEAICGKVAFTGSLELMREWGTVVMESLEGGEPCDVAADLYLIPRKGGTRQRDIEDALYRLPGDKLLRVVTAALLLDLGAKMEWADNTTIIALAGAYKVDRVRVAKAVDEELNPKPATPKPDLRKAAIGKLPAMHAAKPAAKKQVPPAPKKAATAKPVLRPPVKKAAVAGKKSAAKGKRK